MSKKRRANQLEEITFDPAARQEYLTGFHKRKLQRIENARDAAQKREREERVEDRRKLRAQRKEDLEKHVAEVNAELRKQNPDLASNDESGGDSGEDAVAGPLAEVEQDEEFVDEDKFTTVTVEAMGGSEEEEPEDAAEKAKREAKYAKGRNSKPKGKPKAKKKKFRYESRAERGATRQKQKSKNHAAMVRRKGT